MSQPAPRSRPRPRIAIFGAGSVGCQLGGRLAAFADITLIGRPAVLDALADGLTVTGAGRPATVVEPERLTLAETPDAVAGADFVLVTVKSAATAEAGRQLAGRLSPAAIVVSLQNGVRNPAVLRAALPGHTVLAGMVPYNVLRTEPAVFHQGTSGVLMIDANPRAIPLVDVLAEAGISVQVREDMPEVQHAKLLMNLNNAINALSGLPLRDQLGQRDYRACLALCQGEALIAFRAEGIRPAKLGPGSAARNRQLLGLPDPLFRRLAGSALRIDAKARSSMWEDLQRGRRTEVDSVQGEILAIAERNGLTAPANARMIALIREAEAAPAGQARQWSGPDLLAELTTAVEGS
ncbi:2-dehydropantoate 2-reductase [Embleya scabrispora]|uniref:2-dehydropantoate 2-reductase n=1 Tax=Embleya scabrispora TaxID=159449 RepID=UPI00036C18AE|nr:2-dehydropantoate 2-reductase [Embleya scabrispora]